VLEITTPYCRQTGENVDTDTELGEKYSQVALTTRVKIPEAMLFYLVLLISSYNKGTGSTSFCLKHPQLEHNSATFLENVK
jgi:hypothetical protein